MMLLQKEQHLSLPCYLGILTTIQEAIDGKNRNIL
jgi:hypothetical protein